MAERSHRPFHELDVVETVVDSGRWPAGTVGTVIETDDPSAVLIEISDEHGHSLDFASLPRRALRLVQAPVQEHLPV